MNIAIILAGGSGSRLSDNIPKQYIEVNNRPIFSYSVNTFNLHPMIDGIVIVAEENWQEYINKWVIKDNISKFIGYAAAGRSRQHSILNGLQFIKDNYYQEGINVFIHDAARPNITNQIITDCAMAINYHEGVLPKLQVTDTIYYTKDGVKVDKLLDRDCLFIGQTPDVFRFDQYYQANIEISEQELACIRGSAQLGFQKGLEIFFVNGDANNFKITTKTDLECFINQFESKK